MRRSRLPHAAFVGCGLIWGSTFLVIRIGNDSLPPLWACCLRLCLACLILNLILLGTGQKWPRGQARKAAIWYGIWEFGISMPLLYWGERVVPSGLAAILYAICPIAAMFEARAMGMEELDPRKLGAAVLAFSGVAVIFWRELDRGGSVPGLGAIFVAALAAPVAALMLQRGPRQGAVGGNAIGSFCGAVLCLCGSFALREAHPMPLTPSQFLPVLYLGIAGSTCAFVMFAWLVQHWKASTVAFLGVIIPVMAVVLGWLFRHEGLALGSLAGALAVLFGVVIAVRSEAPLRASNRRNLVK